MTKTPRCDIIHTIFKQMRDIGKLTSRYACGVTGNAWHTQSVWKIVPNGFFYEVNLMKFKSKLFDENAIKRALVRISHEITERNDGVRSLVLVGIKSRGVPLARIIAANIEASEGVKIETHELDIRFYRDDLSAIAVDPVVSDGEKFDVKGKTVVLVDDVLYTGRTARAAMEALIKMGRPAFVQLAVLVDRGHRELPIRADFVGKNLPTARNEVVKVNIPPYDEDMSVELYEQ